VNRADTIVCEAIASMRLLIVVYGGATRLVQPHVYGDDHSGARMLSAYQLSGGSTSGASTGWKSFRMDRVASVALSEERFHAPRPEFQHDDGAFARILCQLG